MICFQGLINKFSAVSTKFVFHDHKHAGCFIYTTLDMRSFPFRLFNLWFSSPKSYSLGYTVSSDAAFGYVTLWLVNQ